MRTDPSLPRPPVFRRSPPVAANATPPGEAGRNRVRQLASCAAARTWRSRRSPSWSPPRLVSFAESYRALYDWAAGHGLSGLWAGGLAAAGRRVHRGRRAGAVRRPRRRAGRAGRGSAAWAVTLAGLAVSVAGNVGHVGRSRPLSDRATAAVPPLAAAAALAVGLGVLKRVVEHRPASPQPQDVFVGVPSNVVEAATASMRPTAQAGNPWSINLLADQFSLTRAQATKIHRSVLAESNGHDPKKHPGGRPGLENRRPPGSLPKEVPIVASVIWAVLIAFVIGYVIWLVYRVTISKHALARHRAWAMRHRISARLRPGPGFATVAELWVHWSKLAALSHGHRARPGLRLWDRLTSPATAYAVRFGRAQYGRRGLRPDAGPGADARAAAVGQERHARRPDHRPPGPGRVHQHPR